MIIKQGDIWKEFENDPSENKWIVVTINGYITKNNYLVMGRGIAAQAANRFKTLPFESADRIKGANFKVQPIWNYRVLLFPVKYNWSEPAKIHLIEKSCKELLEFYEICINAKEECKIYTVMPGCGNGRLKWNQVEPIMNKYFSEINDIILVDINYNERKSN